MIDPWRCHTHSDRSLSISAQSSPLESTAPPVNGSLSMGGPAVAIFEIKAQTAKTATAYEGLWMDIIFDVAVSLFLPQTSSVDENRKRIVFKFMRRIG